MGGRRFQGGRDGSHGSRFLRRFQGGSDLARSAMNEAQEILLSTLNSSGVSLPAGISSIKDLAPDALVSICAQSLRLLDDNESTPSFPTSLPESTAERFKICADIASAVTALGYRGDLSFHQATLRVLSLGFGARSPGVSLLVALFMYNEDIKSIADFPFSSSSKAKSQEVMTVHLSSMQEDLEAKNHHQLISKPKNKKRMQSSITEAGGQQQEEQEDSRIKVVVADEDACRAQLPVLVEEGAHKERAAENEATLPVRLVELPFRSHAPKSWISSSLSMPSRNSSMPPPSSCTIRGSRLA